jgi:hypothetical protein
MKNQLYFLRMVGETTIVCVREKNLVGVELSSGIWQAWYWLSL